MRLRAISFASRISVSLNASKCSARLHRRLDSPPSYLFTSFIFTFVFYKLRETNYTEWFSILETISTIFERLTKKIVIAKIRTLFDPYFGRDIFPTCDFCEAWSNVIIQKNGSNLCCFGCGISHRTRAGIYLTAVNDINNARYCGTLIVVVRRASAMHAGSSA